MQREMSLSTNENEVTDAEKRYYPLVAGDK